MKEKKSKILIFTVSITIIALIFIQYYWLNYAFKIESEQFNISVNESLSDLTKKLARKHEANIFINVIKENKISIPANKKTIEKFFTNSDSSNKVINLQQNEKNKKLKIEKFFNVSEKNNVQDSIRQKIILHYADSLEIASNIKNKITISSRKDTLFSKKLKWQKKDTLNNNIVIISTNDDALKLNFDSLQTLKENIVDTLIGHALVKFSDDEIKNKFNNKEFYNLLKDELKSKGIKADFTYKIYQNKIKSNGLNDNLFEAKLYPNNLFDNNYISLNFPNKNTYIFKQLQIMLLFSLLIVLTISYLFYKTLRMYLLQKKMSEIKSDFLNNITHEFKTPISTINIAQSIIDEHSSDTVIKKYTEVIKYESKKLNNLVENLLNTAEYERGIYKLNFDNFDINELIESLKESIININKTITINLEFNATKSIVKGDKEHLRNAFLNIIDNGIKYNLNNPIIDIITLNESNRILIQFIDNGMGIEKKYFNKIFDTFYRIPTGNIHNIKGQGIGLNYVKNIIELHNGTIDVSSELNKGSTFIIGLKFE